MGHSYAHPSNRFWKLLHSSGCTTYLMKPDEDRKLLWLILPYRVTSIAHRAY